MPPRAVKRILFGQYISPEASAFLNRTTGLDSRHRNAYIKLINGLVIDGVWSSLDALYVLSTLNSTTALLSLVNSTYNLTVNGSPTFAADAGYTGALAANYLDTGFNPSTMTTGNYVTNSNLLFCWSMTAAQDAGFAIGAKNDGSNKSIICPRNASDLIQWRTQASTLVTLANTDGTGLYSMERTGSTASALYKNGAQVSTSAAVSSAFGNANLTLLEGNGASNFWSGQMAVAGFGGPLGATKQLALYNRIHAYLQTIAGVA